MARVLVIEDDAMMRRTLERLLQWGWHDVLTADDGKKGVEV